MALAPTSARPDNGAAVHKLSVMTALNRTFLGRRVRDIVGKHYELLHHFGFKPLKSAQYYAPNDMDAAFEAPVTTPTVSTSAGAEQAAPAAPQHEGRTFKWKGLPPLDESDLASVEDEAPATEDAAGQALLDLEKALKRVASLIEGEPDISRRYIEVLVGGAVEMAALTKQVLTIETRPTNKLAMGNYHTVIELRESNKSYRARFRREAEAKEAAAKAPASPVVLGHPLGARAGKREYSPKTLELARRALEGRDNDTRTEEQKIADGAAFICDTRCDRPTTQVIAGDFGTYGDTREVEKTTSLIADGYQHPYLVGGVDYHPV